MQTRHDGADRDVEDLGRLGVGEAADVDEHDDVAEVVRHLGERLDDAVLREPREHALLLLGLRVAARRGQAVVEEVVALLHRLGLRPALPRARPVDVQVREDAEQPGAQVRAGLVRAPAPERPRVGLLHQILGLLTRPDQPPGDVVDLVGELERFLLEAHPPARIVRELPRLLRGHLGHRSNLAAHSQAHKTGAEPLLFPLFRIRRPG